MKNDRWGRPHMDGTEECPNDARCFRCGKIPYKQGNPYGAYVIEFYRADHARTMGPGWRSVVAMCSPCAIAMFEWLHPDMANDPAYIAKKDQAMAAIPKFRDMWNASAPDANHMCGGDDG
jgi:hypothetical protein